MALIVIKKSKDSAISKRMLELAKTGDTVLLVQDGVFYAIDEETKKIVDKGIQVFVLEEDLNARGYSKDASIFPCVNYDGWVELLEENELVIS
jgi:tRNA 2-thiouridine synthesizing protein B